MLTFDLGRWAALLILAVPQEAASPAAVTPLTIADPGSYWPAHGFVEMTPPIRLPSRDGREYIAIWLCVPPQREIGITHLADGRSSLVLPPGTIADRVDMVDGRDPRSAGDVRGTRFGVGDEYFHVLRALPPRGLSGVEWPRSSSEAGRAATDYMLDRMEAARDDRGGGMGDSGMSLFIQQNDCAFCHAHDKRERQRFDPALDAEAIPANRATDDSGLYTITTVLTDGAPIETHRPRDMNEADPYISVQCADGTGAELSIGRNGRRSRFVCSDDSVPYARLDMVAALAHGDEHARAVCASRAYLQEHMTAEARAAFSSAFDECLCSAQRAGDGPSCRPVRSRPAVRVGPTGSRDSAGREPRTRVGRLVP